jgi:hypothetical protein
LALPAGTSDFDVAESSPRSQISNGEFESTVCTTAEWRIQDPNRKFRTSAGFALVSPPFDVSGFSDVRLMFSPGAAWSEHNALKQRNQKRSKAAAAAPCNTVSQNGSLKIKVVRDVAKQIEAAEIYFRVGGMQLGPLHTDSLADMPVQSMDIPSDWRDQLQGDNGGFLRVSLEIVRERSGGGI